MKWAQRVVRMLPYLLVALCTLVVLLTYGISMPGSPFEPVPFDGPTTIDGNGDLTVVCDEESRRLLFLDAHDQLASMVRFNSINTPIEAVTEVCVSGDTVYVAGVKFAKDGNSIERECVLTYDRYGAYHGIAYEMSHPHGNEYAIKSLHEMPDGFVMSVGGEVKSFPYASQHLHFYGVRDGVATELASHGVGFDLIYDASYNSACGSYAFTTEYGELAGSDERMYERLREHYIFSSVDVGDDGSAYAFEEISGSLLRIGPSGVLTPVLEGGGITQVTLNGDRISYCARISNKVGLSGDLGSTWRSLTAAVPTRALTATFVLVMACRVLLVASLVYLVARRLLAMLRSGEAAGLGGILASVSVVLAIATAIGYSSYMSYKASLSTRLETIDAFADYFLISTDDLWEDFERCANRKSLRLLDGDDEVVRELARSYYRIVTRLLGLTLAASNNGIGTYACAYVTDEDGVFYLFDGSLEHVLGASLSSPDQAEILAAFEGVAPRVSEMHKGSSRRDVTRYRLVSIPGADGENVRGVIEIGSHMRSFEAALVSDLAARVAGLLVIMAVLYLTYAELRGCGRSLLDYRSYRGRDDDDALALLTRPFTFAITALSSIDSVMTVLIARQLATGVESGSLSVQVALPSVMLGVGLATGYVLYGYVLSHLTPRRLGMLGSLALASFSLLAVVALALQSLPLYCVAKLLLSVPLGSLYAFGYSLPGRADC